MMQRSINQALKSQVLRRSGSLSHSFQKRSLNSFTKFNSQNTSSNAGKYALGLGVGLFAGYQFLNSNNSTIKLDATPAKKEKKVKKESEEIKSEDASAAEVAAETPSDSKPASGEAGEPEEQASAYNPETGEINWDCPCLGGMAHGPCGEEFKEAFSCFIYSTEEPKGIDCIEKFKNMQNCFRQHPEIYSEELRDDEEYGEVPPASDAPAVETQVETQVETPVVAETIVKEVIIDEVHNQPVAVEGVVVVEEFVPEEKK